MPSSTCTQTVYKNCSQKLPPSLRLSSHFGAHGTRKHILTDLQHIICYCTHIVHNWYISYIVHIYCTHILTQLIHLSDSQLARPRGLVLSVGVGRNDGQGLHPMRQVAVGDLGPVGRRSDAGRNRTTSADTQHRTLPPKISKICL